MTNTTITSLINSINSILAENNKPYAVEYIKAYKNNTELDGMRVIPTKLQNLDIAMCPTFYFDNTYSIDKRLEIIDHAYNTSKSFMNELYTNVTDKNYILNNVILAVVSLNNEKYLKNKVYDEFLDLAIIYRIKYNDNYFSDITNNLLTLNDIDMEEIRKAAVLNTADDYMVFDFLHKYELYPEDETSPLIVLTNKSSNYGANTLLNKRALNKACEYYGTDSIYCLPSSIHEIICVDAHMGMLPCDLQDMVQMVNGTIKTDMVLNKSVYKYTYNNKVEKVA